MIRRARHTDFTRIGTLIHQHALYEGVVQPSPVDLQNLQDLALGTAPRIFLWVVDYEGTIGGYMSATIDYSTWQAAPFVHMDCLYLEPALRGQGVGRQFITTLASFAHEQAIDVIEWQTPPDNLAGIGFYQRVGASHLTKQRFALDVRQFLSTLVPT